MFNYCFIINLNSNYNSNFITHSYFNYYFYHHSYYLHASNSLIINYYL